MTHAATQRTDLELLVERHHDQINEFTTKGPSNLFRRRKYNNLNPNSQITYMQYMATAMETNPEDKKTLKETSSTLLETLDYLKDTAWEKHFHSLSKYLFNKGYKLDVDFAAALGCKDLLGGHPVRINEDIASATDLALQLHIRAYELANRDSLNHDDAMEAYNDSFYWIQDTVGTALLTSQHDEHDGVRLVALFDVMRSFLSRNIYFSNSMNRGFMLTTIKLKYPTNMNGMDERYLTDFAAEVERNVEEYGEHAIDLNPATEVLGKANAVPRAYDVYSSLLDTAYNRLLEIGVDSDSIEMSNAFSTLGNYLLLGLKNICESDDLLGSYQKICSRIINRIMPMSKSSEKRNLLIADGHLDYRIAANMFGYVGTAVQGITKLQNLGLLELK